MTLGSAMASRAIGDAARRDLASEWSGPEPAAPQAILPAPHETARRLTIRKP